MLNCFKLMNIIFIYIYISRNGIILFCSIVVGLLLIQHYKLPRTTTETFNYSFQDNNDSSHNYLEFVYHTVTVLGNYHITFRLC